MWAPFFEEDPWQSLMRWPDSVESSHGLEVYETDTEMVVKAPLPGIPEEKIEVSTEGNVLTIRANVEETQEEKDKKKVVYKSSMQRAFSYTTSLPRIVNANKAEAELDNGVLTVKIPKLEDEQPKSIVIKKKSK